MSLRTVMLAGSGLLIAGCSVDRVEGPQARMAASPAVVAEQSPGIYLVEYTPGSEAAVRASVAALGGRVRDQIGAVHLLFVSDLTPAGARQLETRAGITTVIADQLRIERPDPTGTWRRVNGPANRPAGTDQSSAFFYKNGFQWNMQVTHTDAAWKYPPSGGGLGKLICILDTGIDPGHDDLIGKVDQATTVITTPRFPSDAGPLDYDFHGSYVAGIISSNGVGVGSAAPDARLCSIKVLSQDGKGTFGDLLKGIALAAYLKADVINMSLGAFLDMTDPLDQTAYNLLQNSINSALAQGSAVVAAEGNKARWLSRQTIPYRWRFVPAMVPGVIGVGATGPVNQQNYDALAAYSNFGSVEVMDLVAPGGQDTDNLRDALISVCSQYATGLPFTCSTDSYAVGGLGTSFAAPMASGAAAVAESTVGLPMTPGAIALCLRRFADKVGTPYDPKVYGAGRLNVFAVLSCSQFG